MTTLVASAAPLALFLLHVFVPGIYGTYDDCSAPGQRFPSNLSASCPYKVMAAEVQRSTNYVDVEVTIIPQSLQGIDKYHSSTTFATRSNSSLAVIGQFTSIPDYMGHLNCSGYQEGSIIGSSNSNLSLQRTKVLWRGPLLEEMQFSLVAGNNRSTCTASALFKIEISGPSVIASTPSAIASSLPPTTRIKGDGSSVLYSWLRNAGVGVAVIVVMIIFFGFLYKNYTRKQKRKRAQLPLLGHPSPQPERITRITLSPSPLLGRARPGIKNARSMTEVSQNSGRLAVPDVKHTRSLTDITTSGKRNNRKPLGGSGLNVSEAANGTVHKATSVEIRLPPSQNSGSDGV